MTIEVNAKEEMNENLKNTYEKKKQIKIRIARQIMKGKQESCGNGQ